MKKEYNKKTSDFLILKALKLFIENPYEKIYLREFARKTGISLNSAQRFLKIFLKENLIKDSRKANLRFFKANLDSVVFRQIKIAFSLKKIEDTELIEKLKEVSSHLILFGSVAEGLNDSKSDIDLVCIGINSKKIKEIISEFQEKINQEVNCHIFSWGKWKEQTKLNKAFYLDVISKGISLIGDKPIAE